MLHAEQILQLQDVVRQVVVADHVFEYAADLVRTTRPRDAGVPKFVPELVSWGAGPRASQYLILGGKARAILHGAGRRNVVGSVSVWVDGNEHRPSAVAQGTYALPREAAGAA